jgi:hypothetical protein
LGFYRFFFNNKKDEIEKSTKGILKEKRRVKEIIKNALVYLFLN